MSCQYPKNSRSYKLCMWCNMSKFCDESTVGIPPMPKVKPPKKDESEIEKAIKLLIDNEYAVTKLVKENQL